MNDNVLILGIETSCDETAAAVVENGRNVLSNIISSQIEIHKEFGGVVPEVASRKHIENINIIIEKALKEANVDFKDIDIVLANHPGDRWDTKANWLAFRKLYVDFHGVASHAASAPEKGVSALKAAYLFFNGVDISL